MNTERLNPGLSLRGTPEFGGVKAKVAKGDLSSTTKSEKGPDSFAEAMSAQKSPPPSRKESAPVSRKETDAGPGRTEPQDDTPSVKSKLNEGLEKPKPKKAAGSEREKAMLEFMDSMESEFGIPPQKIVEAMAQLPNDQIEKSPEETASQVIESLDLPPEQEAKASEMYVGLLNQLAQNPAPVEPKAVPAASNLSQQMSQQSAMSTRERRAMLNDSLDRLSQRFFLNDQKINADAAGATVARNELKGLDPSTDAMGARNFANEGNSDPMMADQTNWTLPPGEIPNFENNPGAGPLPPELKPPPQGASGAAGMKSVPKTSEPPPTTTDELIKRLTALNNSAGDLAQSVEKMPTGAKVLDATPTEAPSVAPNFAQAFSVGAMAKGAASQNSEFGESANSDSKDADSKMGSQDLKSIDSGRMDASTLEKPLGFQETMKATAPMAAQPNRHEAQANIDKIMSQASLIIRKGGGEAKIRMNPEGLGEVQLKVMVKDGKVNVEMATETKEAKKLLESSLSELKSGLGHHKLAVDSVKVDMGLQSSNDSSSQQKNPEFRQDAGRDQARQFFQNFREENMGKRDPFFEMPGAKAYSRPSQGAAPLQPVSERKNRTAGDGRGERMNLVA